MHLFAKHFAKLAAETLSIGANVKYSVSFRWPSQRFRSRKSLATFSFWNSCLPQARPMDPPTDPMKKNACFFWGCCGATGILRGCTAHTNRHYITPLHSQVMPSLLYLLPASGTHRSCCFCCIQPRPQCPLASDILPATYKQPRKIRFPFTSYF